METKIIKIDQESYFNKILNYPAKILKTGGLVAFPTETVYGLGANALDAEAIKKIFEAKGRPGDNPLIVHISNIEDLDDLVGKYSGMVKKVISKFWPGPLTIVFKRSEIVPDIVTAGLDTVAVRMPENPIAKKLIDISGVPVAAPSANLSGKPSPTQAKHVIEDLSGKIDCIIDGGVCDVGLESTVLDLSEEQAKILRPGGVTIEEIREIIPSVVYDPALENKDLIPKSPGMKYIHYAPNADVFMLENFDGTLEKKEALIHLINQEFQNQKVGFMGSKSFVDLFNEYFSLSLGHRGNMEKIASNLFKVLREFDENKVDVIIAESFEKVGVGHAIMNRLSKSAGYKMIKL